MQNESSKYQTEVTSVSENIEELEKQICLLQQVNELTYSDIRITAKRPAHFVFLANHQLKFYAVVFLSNCNQNFLKFELICRKEKKVLYVLFLLRSVLNCVLGVSDPVNEDEAWCKCDFLY